jgi:hypothetical protein
MNEENLAVVDTAPAAEVTATTESAQIAPEVADSQVETPEEKKFSQADIDAMISKRLAREQRKWEREQQARTTQPVVRTEVPPIENFESADAYAEALAVRKAEEMIAQRDYQKQQSAVNEAYHDREEEARAKYDDFEQVAYNPQLRVTDAMAETIKASDVGPDLAYWLGSNPKEADRISRLSPLMQAREIGRIEAKIGSSPTTDPRSVKAMSTSDWIEADRARQMKKLQAQLNR